MKALCEILKGYDVCLDEAPDENTQTVFRQSELAAIVKVSKFLQLLVKSKRRQLCSNVEEKVASIMATAATPFFSSAASLPTASLGLNQLIAENKQPLFHTI